MYSTVMAAKPYPDSDSPASGSGGHSSTVLARVESELRSRVSGGFYSEGTRLPGMRVLAEELNCSLALIQMAVNNLVTEGWIKTRPRAGMIAAKPLSRNELVTLVLPTLQLEQMDKLVRGTRRGLRQTGLHLVIQSADSDFDDQVQLLERIDARQFAGVIICPPLSDDYSGPIRKFVDRGIPTVQATYCLDNSPPSIC
jgi:DNA-binding transcriptional regulator YhcF (GntR family)